MSLHVKTGDTVIVLSGRDKGRKGKVLKTDPKESTVVVENIQVATKHKKPRRQGEQGGIIKQETPLDACKVMRVCPKCGKPTRPAHAFSADGEKSRVCKHCGEII